DLPATNPVERLAVGRGVGIVVVVHEELRRALVAGVALPLNRLPCELLTIAEVAVGEVVRGRVHQEVAGRVDRATGLEDEHVEPLLDQLLGGPAPGDPGPDHDRIPTITSARS